MSEAVAPKKKGNGLVRFFVWFLVIILMLAALAAAGAYGAWRWVQNEFEEPGPAATDQVTFLPRGAGLIRIANQLEAEGLIEDARIFRLMITLDEGDRDLKAGEYAIPARASMADIYVKLREGDVIQHPVTFAEGLTSAMIVDTLNAADVLIGEITEIPPEGSLLPETYLVDRGTPRAELIARMTAAQDTLLAELWENRAEDLPFDTIEEAIILASVVEKETGVAAERPQVAAVFVNRLRRGMRLESDPTIIYGISEGRSLGRGIRRSELDNADNPYNTYQNDGLPPTPIANPGRDSIAAVLNPADIDALFFVADGTGGHAFAETYSQHLRNVAEWRRIERERRNSGN